MSFLCRTVGHRPYPLLGYYSLMELSGQIFYQILTLRLFSWWNVIILSDLLYINWNARFMMVSFKPFTDHRWPVLICLMLCKSVVYVSAQCELLYVFKRLYKKFRCDNLLISGNLYSSRNGNLKFQDSWQKNILEQGSGITLKTS